MRSQLEITSFTDAIAVAFGVRRRFTHGHTAVLLEAFGQVVDLTVFSLRSSSIDTALGWAGCLVTNDTRCVRRMVLVSAVDGLVGEGPPAADVSVLRQARERFGELGVLVVDWLQCDGNVVRSTDLAADGEGWRLAAGGRLSA